MNIFLISHIADADGIAPVILTDLVFDHYDYYLCETNEVDNAVLERLNDSFFAEYNKLLVTDLCVSEEVAEVINSSKYKDKIIILDHHINRADLNRYPFINVVDESNGIKESGTSLYYQYLCENYANETLLKPSVQYFVTLVRLYDTWEWNRLGVEEASNITILLNHYGIDHFINHYIKFLRNNYNFYFNENELFLIDNENKKVMDYLEEHKDKVIFKEIDGYSVGIVFAELYRSKLGNYLAEYYKDKADFIIIINMGRSISYRSCKDNNVGLFAQKYGGNGHKKAAGSPLPEGLEEYIIDYIFKEELHEGRSM